ncbi:MULTISPECIES: 1,2-phenylacetyl-CoA epoxidase subunit PaaB [unclassified Streptomyces]|uniref:1,2-phenylacetyl-CoA epoxidase subunit PaaB n=1 Tax=unclassified Streptomyces TaxID=2593676 RepID=UPI0022B6A6EF|nr:MULTISPECIES: 1,2-phenylacetyl-CoA epoxidase subunit PaaB [unclassified Streptomyces]MCZ7417816.1 1,2-phenylacetyl-CoA epoxidase subunit B [Streptomyces sp. WMMC897]MCZ7432379.1 1,2-phenylacetyl-CoA epoxidase subunit B [Streptomyces sp. WMMC1477]
MSTHPTTAAETPWEVFLRSRRGLGHQHVGSVLGADAELAMANARDLYTRRGEPASIWVVRSTDVHATSPDEKEPMFSNGVGKPYRLSEQYAVPAGGGDHDHGD